MYTAKEYVSIWKLYWIQNSILFLKSSHEKINRNKLYPVAFSRFLNIVTNQLKYTIFIRQFTRVMAQTEQNFKALSRSRMNFSIGVYSCRCYGNRVFGTVVPVPEIKINNFHDSPFYVYIHCTHNVRKNWMSLFFTHRC